MDQQVKNALKRVLASHVTAVEQLHGALEAELGPDVYSDSARRNVQRVFEKAQSMILFEIDQL